MNEQFLLETQGNPLGRLQNFMQAIWQEAPLEGMLVPMNGNGGGSMAPALIKDKEDLGQVNPFRPLMTENAARRLPALLKENPDQQLGALLRPCEVRALIEMVKHNGFRPDHLLMLSVDCLATYDVEDYGWRAERKRQGGKLSDEALQFARQGGISPYRYRSACQVCYSPEARGADVNIRVLGLPVRRVMLVQARDEQTADRLRLGRLTDGPASLDFIAQHNRLVEKLEAHRQQTRQRLCDELGSLLPRDAAALVEQFEACADCQRCMEVCPICAVDFPQRDASSHYEEGDICRWLVSCAGCGMCEQACPRNQPLGLIFGRIREQLLAETAYVPGRDYLEPLPIG